MLFIPSFCGILPFCFIIYAMIAQLTFSGDTWTIISVIAIIASVFGLIFAVPAYKKTRSQITLSLVALNGINILLYCLNIISYV